MIKPKCPSCNSTKVIKTETYIRCAKCYYTWYKEAPIETRNWEINKDEQKEEIIE